MRSGKEYVCLMHLHGDVSEEEFAKVLSEFVGPIYQVPPVRSSVARRPRLRTIYELEVIERKGRDVLMRVASSGGTYIRKLCVDIGTLLGCGAHMQELRRTRVGALSEESARPLIELYAAAVKWRREGDERALLQFVKPIEDALIDLPRIEVLDTTVDAICHGAPLAEPGIARMSENVERGDLVAVFTLKGELVCLAKAVKSTNEALEEGGIVAKSERVIMERGTYPPFWKGRWVRGAHSS